MRCQACEVVEAGLENAPFGGWGEPVRLEVAPQYGGGMRELSR